MRPGCGLVFGVWGVDRRPDPTAKLTFVGKPYAGPQCLIPIQGEWGGLGPGPHADSSPTEEEEEERERESSHFGSSRERFKPVGGPL